MISKKQLTEKVHRMKEIKCQISDLNLEYDNLKSEIQADMLKRGVSELTGEDWCVSWIYYNRNNFDTESFKEEHPKLYESYHNVKEVQKFLVN